MKNDKLKNDDRLIARMVSSIMLTVGALGIVGGAILGNIAVNETPIEYVDNIKYILGVSSVTLGATSLSLGFANYPYKNNKEETDNQENNNENENTL